MQTRCPHCQTLFEIQEEQLRAASGQARCSYCDNIFNAQKHLAQKQPDKRTKQAIEHPQDRGSAISLNALFEDTDLEQSDFPKLYTGTPPSDFDSNQNLNPTVHKPLQIEAKQPPSHSEKIEHDDESHTPRDKPSIAAILQRRDADTTKRRPVRSALVKASNPQIPQRVLDTQVLTDHISISQSITQSSHTKKKKPREQPLLWSFAILCLLATALVQIAWFSRDRLTSFPEVRELMELVCMQAGCNLPPWHEPERFEITSRSVRTHPESNKALQIKLVFSNAARFAQRYPQLQLRLYDTNENLSAQRIFRPDEYLAKPGFKTSLIEPAQSVEVDMALADPGLGITGFKIEFL